MSQPRFLYVFLDEAGNFDFSPKGTRYFIFGAIVKERPFHAYQDLSQYKYDLIEMGIDIEYFHASEDKQHVRDRVFKIIQGNITGVDFYALILEKAKTFSTLRTPERFYPKMLGYQLKFILNRSDLKEFQQVIIFTNRIPVTKKRSVVEKAVKKTLTNMLPEGVTYRILHHDSKSNIDLQIADYFTWATFRDWENNDSRSYELIKSAIKNEFDMFAHNLQSYYEHPKVKEEK